MKNILLIVSLFAGLVLTSLLFFTPGLPTLDDSVRETAQAEGTAYDFASLSEGKIHYRLSGPEHAPTILLIHGFQTPSFVWDDHIEALTGAGFRVLSFDNYGRGFSDRPEGDYTTARTDTLIMELLAALKISRPLHIVGYSMGGSTAAHFVANHPEKARSLTLIAPAGTGTMPLFVRLLTLPILGDFVMEHLGSRLSNRRAAQAAEKSPNPARFLALQQIGASFAGNHEALLSSMRHYPLWDAHATYETVSKTGIPVQIIWGKEDETVSFAEADTITSLVPNATLHAFEGIGHEITFANPDLVAPLIVSFVEAHRLRQVSSGNGGKARSPEGRLEPVDCLCHLPSTTD